MSHASWACFEFVAKVTSNPDSFSLMWDFLTLTFRNIKNPQSWESFSLRLQSSAVKHFRQRSNIPVTKCSDRQNWFNYCQTRSRTCRNVSVWFWDSTKLLQVDVSAFLWYFIMLLLLRGYKQKHLRLQHRFHLWSRPSFCCQVLDWEGRTSLRGEQLDGAGRTRTGRTGEGRTQRQEERMLSR